MKKIFYLFLLYSNIVLAKTDSNYNLSNQANDLLKTLSWEKFFKFERNKDVTYLLGSIDGPLLQELTIEQKTQIIASMRDAVLKQIFIDMPYFKNYLVGKYIEFFSLDELTKLNQYFRTELMQTVITSQLDGKKITAEELLLKIDKSNEQDKKIIENFRESYLRLRYIRFDEKIMPEINKMIFNRMKEILSVVFKEVPNFIKETKKPIS